MAFGKKKDEQNPAAVEAEAEAAGASLESAFAGGAEAPAELEPAASEPAPQPVAEAAPATEPLAGGADDLLSAFTTTENESEDRSMILDLAGEHDLDDLLEELHTVATALGIVFDEDGVAA